MVAAKCERELRNLDVSFVTFPLRVHLRQLNKAKRLQTYLFYGSQSKRHSVSTEHWNIIYV